IRSVPRWWKEPSLERIDLKYITNTLELWLTKKGSISYEEYDAIRDALYVIFAYITTKDSIIVTNDEYTTIEHILSTIGARTINRFNREIDTIKKLLESYIYQRQMTFSDEEYQGTFPIEPTEEEYHQDPKESLKRLIHLRAPWIQMLYDTPTHLI